MAENNNKWHQKWWGIIILLFFVVILIYVGAFIYEAVAYIEETVYNNTQYYNPGTNLGLESSSVDQSVRQIAITADDPYTGSENPVVTIVEFSDWQCPYCQSMSPIVNQLANKYFDKVKIIYRDFPNITTHTGAVKAAVASECADEQGLFWHFHDYIFANQSNWDLIDFKQFASDLGMRTDLFNDCYDNNRYGYEVINDLQDGYELKITGTPTFFIFGPRSSLKLTGTISFEDFSNIIDSYLLEKQIEDIK